MSQTDWLQKVLSIDEDTPYHGALTIAGGRCIKGTTLFRMQDGDLGFRFFIDDAEPREAALEAFSTSSRSTTPLELRIPSHDFAYVSRITGVPSRGMTGHPQFVEGRVETHLYGPFDETSAVATAWLRGIPTGWIGPDYRVHYYGINREPMRRLKNGEAILPASSSLGLTALGGFTLQTDSWTTILGEIPAKDRTDPEVCHSCTIRPVDGMMTAEAASEFIEEDLLPFLAFVFGRKIRCTQIVGGPWAIVPAQQKNLPTTLNGNWFLRSRANVRLSSPFQSYCNLAPEVKEHWRRVIDQYATSEEIMGTLGETAVAASVSFSALEGLTRSFISTYEVKDEWLDKDLKLKPRKKIIEAVEMVAKKELGAHETVFEQASRAVYSVRNQTMHLDLEVEEDANNAFHRWNSSQALVEILMLAKMGLKGIPNRTAHGVFNVLGEDMYGEVRKEELVFDQTVNPSEVGS